MARPNHCRLRNWFVFPTIYHKKGVDSMYNPNENRFGDPEDQFTRPPRRAASPMAMAAVSCAIIAILTSITGIVSIIFASLGILFACLSKGSRSKPERATKYAFRISIIAMIISGVLMLFSLVTVIRQYGSLQNYYNSYLEMIEENYGIDLEDIYGIDSGQDYDIDSDTGYTPETGTGEAL
ncbi:MAG: hypothetical protein LIO96_12280 [Lachnospiraceae bacterium]|nr:hypothetical protein [Lachnospiraceae bacterium]